MYGMTGNMNTPVAVETAPLAAAPDGLAAVAEVTVPERGVADTVPRREVRRRKMFSPLPDLRRLFQEYWHRLRKAPKEQIHVTKAMFSDQRSI